MTYHGKEVVEDVDEVGGWTRSGRCFVPESLRKSKPTVFNIGPVEENPDHSTRHQKVC